MQFSIAGFGGMTLGALTSIAAFAQYEPKVPSNYDEVMRAQPQTAPPAGEGNRMLEPRKWYVGLGAGRTAFNHSDLDETKASLRSTGATSFTVTPEGYDWLGKLYLGYRFSPHWGVEGGYWHFGGPDYRADVTAPSTVSFRREFKLRGAGVGILFEAPITPTVAGVLKAGVMRTNTTASATPATGGLTALPEETARQWRPHFAVAGRYRISERLAARGEYEFIPKVGNAETFGQANVHGVSIGMEVGF